MRWSPASTTDRPKKVWKFVSPFVPPVSDRLPTMTITNAAASAWLRIAKYAPRMRWRKTAVPSSAAIAIGSAIAIGTANHAWVNGFQSVGSDVYLPL